MIGSKRAGGKGNRKKSLKRYQEELKGQMEKEMTVDKDTEGNKMKQFNKVI